jgi:dephospho-CoA kinase
VLIVGLTGGIASGKSTVSALLAEHGAVVIDYDRLAREVVEPGTTALLAIVERFGDDVVHDDGTLDRPALGSIVFSDVQARRDLESITHGAIRDRAQQLTDAAGDDAIVVHDNPLLVEMGAASSMDVVLVVDVPVEQQVRRMVEDRGMSEVDARSRLDAQASRDERAAVADHLIDNSGSIEQLPDVVADVWRALQSRLR